MALVFALSCKFGFELLQSTNGRERILLVHDFPEHVILILSEDEVEGFRIHRQGAARDPRHKGHFKLSRLDQIC